VPASHPVGAQRALLRYRIHVSRVRTGDRFSGHRGAPVLALADRRYYQNHHRLSRPGESQEPNKLNGRWQRIFDRLLSPATSHLRGRLTQSMRLEGILTGSVGAAARRGRRPSPVTICLIQLWFAGQSSDMGWSYPEPESRLSDIALAWMCEGGDEGAGRPQNWGRYSVMGTKNADTGDAGPVLNIFPAAMAWQHCEIAGMRDTLDSYAAKLPKWRWLAALRRQHELGSPSSGRSRTTRRSIPLSPAASHWLKSCSAQALARIGPKRFGSMTVSSAFICGPQPHQRALIVRAPPNPA